MSYHNGMPFRVFIWKFCLGGGGGGGGDPRKGTGELFWFLLISHLNNTLGNQ